MAETYPAISMPPEQLDFAVVPTRSGVHSSAYADASEHIHCRHRDQYSQQIEVIFLGTPFRGLELHKDDFLEINQTFDTSFLQGLLPARPIEGIVIKNFAQNGSLDGNRAQLHHALGETDRAVPSTFDHIEEPQADGHQLIYDPRGLATQILIRPQDTESLSQQIPGHSRNTHRVTVCHALIGTSIVGIATSLSLALWWSIAHGDPGSGFTIGSYVLAAFGVLVAIPGYPHSKVCRCWESKPKGT